MNLALSSSALQGPESCPAAVSTMLWACLSHTSLSPSHTHFFPPNCSRALSRGQAVVTGKRCFIKSLALPLLFLYPFNPCTLDSPTCSTRCPPLATQGPGTPRRLASPSLPICAHLCLSQPCRPGAPHSPAASDRCLPIPGSQGRQDGRERGDLGCYESSSIFVLQKLQRWPGHLGSYWALSLPDGVVWVLSFCGAPPHNH